MLLRGIKNTDSLLPKSIWTLFFIFFVSLLLSSTFFLRSALAGVGEGTFSGEIKSLIPEGYQYSFDAQEEEEPLTADEPPLASSFNNSAPDSNLTPEVYRKDQEISASYGEKMPSQVQEDVVSRPLLRQDNTQDINISESGTSASQESLSPVLEDSFLDGSQQAEEEQIDQEGAFLPEDPRETIDPPLSLDEGIPFEGDQSYQEKFDSPTIVQEDLNNQTFPIHNDTSVNGLSLPSPDELQDQNSIKSDGYNFNMISLGIEGGAALVSHAYHSSLGSGTDAQPSSYEGALGLRFIWETFLQDTWTAGVTAAWRGYLGGISNHHTTSLSAENIYKSKNTQRYEIAGKFGKWIGSVHPYLKLGPVFSNISINTKDMNSNFTSSASQWVWGGTLGGGIESEISKGLILGGGVEYDRYFTIRNSINDMEGVGAGYKVSPSFVNLMVSLTWKLDQFI